MEARKLAGQMAAICPFALILGMGYSARQPVLGRPTLQYSEAQNERLEAYTPIVREPLPNEPEPELVRRHADAWIRTAAIEHLQALTPAYQEDTSEENARSEIIGDWRWLVQSLNHNMRRELIEGNNALAVEDAARLIRVGEILKYSDFTSLHIATTTATHAIAILGPVLGKVSESDQKELKAAASEMNANRGKLPTLYKVIKGNYEDYLARRVGFGEFGGEVPGSSDEDASAIGQGTTNLQRTYVLAVQDEAKLRENQRVFLGLRFNPLKS